MATQANPNYTLTGRITNRQGEPLEGLIVCACDQDPKTPNPLGEDAITDTDGRYKISFTEEDFKTGGKESGGPDVFIRVYDGDELLGESPVKRNSKKRITINSGVNYVKAGAGDAEPGGRGNYRASFAAPLVRELGSIGQGSERPRREYMDVPLVSRLLRGPLYRREVKHV